MRFNDTLSGLLLFVFGIAVVLYASTFSAAPAQNIGAGLFPILIGFGFTGCGAVLFWSGQKQARAPWLVVEAWVRRPRLAVNVALVIGALIFYAVAVETTGFFVTAFIFLVALFLAFDVRRRWIAPIAAAVTLGLHVAFYSLLRVPLPWGWLEGIAW
jgi:putative tricarboxylic transport membrane protein